jgi:hypothetical protein
MPDDSERRRRRTVHSVDETPQAAPAEDCRCAPPHDMCIFHWSELDVAARGRWVANYDRRHREGFGRRT